MKKIIQPILFLTIIFLVLANIFFFYFSLKLANEIGNYEVKINKIHHENINLETELAKVSSLNYARQLAEKMDFNQKAQPIFLNNFAHTFALNK